MDVAGALLSVLLTLLLVTTVFAGWVVGVVALVRFFRNGSHRRTRPSSLAAAAESLVAPQHVRALPGPRAGDPVFPAAPPSMGGPSDGGPQLGDAERTLEWRYEQFLQLGLDPLAAVELADSMIDLGAMRALVDRGCPASLAGRILY